MQIFPQTRIVEWTNTHTEEKKKWMKNIANHGGEHEANGVTEQCETRIRKQFSGI